MFSGEILKRIRESRKIPVSALAKEFGCTRQYIHKLEQSSKPPSRKMLEKYSAYFNVSTDYLIGNQTDPNSITIYTLGTGLPQGQLMRIPSSFFKEGKQYFGLSLHPTELIICERNFNLLFGKAGVFKYNGEHLYGEMRRFKNGTSWLICDEHPPLHINIQELIPIGYASYRLFEL